jgi:hypothetical protein
VPAGAMGQCSIYYQVCKACVDATAAQVEAANSRAGAAAVAAGGARRQAPLVVLAYCPRAACGAANVVLGPLGFHR